MTALERGDHVVQYERIEVPSENITYLRKTWDNGYLDIYYVRGKFARDRFRRDRGDITQTKWDSLAKKHRVLTRGPYSQEELDQLSAAQ